MAATPARVANPCHKKAAENPAHACAQAHCGVFFTLGMAKKDPQPPRDGKTEKPPAPPPFQRLTTPSKWVAPMSAAPPSFRRQKVDVVRAPQARNGEPTPEAPKEPSAPQARRQEAAPPDQSTTPAVEPSAPEPVAVEPIVGRATEESAALEPEQTIQPESTSVPPEQIAEVQPEPVATAEDFASTRAKPTRDQPDVVEPEVIDTEPAARPYTRPAPQIGPEFVPTDADAPRPSRRPIPKYPILARTRLILAALCAVVFLAIAVWASGLWLHSLGVIDRGLFESSAGTSHWAESYAGAIYLHAESVPPAKRRVESFWQLEMGDRFARFDPPPDIPGAGAHGLTRATITLARTGAPVSYTVISYWLIVLTLIVPGALAIWSFRRLRRRLKQFRCANCRADLRTSPFRCPSCGTPGPLADSDYNSP